MRPVSRIRVGTIAVMSLALLPVSGAIHQVSPAGKVTSATRGHAAGSKARATVRNDHGDGSAVEVTDGQVHLFLTPQYVGSIIGMDPATLQQDLQAGQTILQAAGGKYSSATDLAIALVAPFKMKMDRAVASGELTPDKGSQLYAGLLSAAEALVVTQHPDLSPAGDRPGSNEDSRHLRIGLDIKDTILSAVASSCNTTVSALTASLEPGTSSVLSVCQTTNPNATVDTLSSAITTALTAQLDAAVRAGAITSTEETNILTKVAKSMSTWLTNPMGPSGSEQKA